MHSWFLGNLDKEVQFGLDLKIILDLDFPLLYFSGPYDSSCFSSYFLEGEVYVHFLTARGDFKNKCFL